MPQRFHRNVTRHGHAGLLLCLLGGAATAADLRIEVTPAPAGGVLHAALYAASGDWSAPLRRVTADNGGPVLIKDVPPGRYAVQLFVDLDGDGELALSPRGIPREPVGFSTNPGLLRGKPTPEKCAFVQGDGDTLLQIRLRQRRER